MCELVCWLSGGVLGAVGHTSRAAWGPLPACLSACLYALSASVCPPVAGSPPCLALLPACLLAAGLLLFVRWLPGRSGRHGVEPTAGAKRNVETRCSKIAHVGIIILAPSIMQVLSVVACAIFEQRVSTLCLAPASCSANCRPDLMQARPACALLGWPVLSWAMLGFLRCPGLSCRLGSPFACRHISVPYTTCGVS